MPEVIFLIVLFSSLAGMAILIYEKMPLLSKLPEIEANRFNWQDFLIKIKKNLPFKNFSSETFLQKILSKIRILTLKTDSKTSGLLQKLREKAKEKKLEKSDNYWQEVKKFKKK